MGFPGRGQVPFGSGLGDEDNEKRTARMYSYFHFQKYFILISVFMNVCPCTYVHMHVGTCGDQKRASDLLKWL